MLYWLCRIHPCFVCRTHPQLWTYQRAGLADCLCLLVLRRSRFVFIRPTCRATGMTCWPHNAAVQHPADCAEVIGAGLRPNDQKTTAGTVSLPPASCVLCPDPPAELFWECCSCQPAAVTGHGDDHVPYNAGIQHPADRAEVMCAGLRTYDRKTGTALICRHTAYRFAYQGFPMVPIPSGLSSKVPRLSCS